MKISQYKYTVTISLSIPILTFFERFEPSYMIPILCINPDIKIYTGDKFPWSERTLYNNKTSYMTIGFIEKIMSSINTNSVLNKWISIKVGSKYKYIITSCTIRSNSIIFTIENENFELDDLCKELRRFDPNLIINKSNVTKMVTLSDIAFDMDFLRNITFNFSDITIDESDDKNIFSENHIFKMGVYTITFNNKSKNVCLIHCNNGDIMNDTIKTIMHFITDCYKSTISKLDDLHNSMRVYPLQSNVLTKRIVNMARYIKTNYNVEPQEIEEHEKDEYEAKGIQVKKFENKWYVCPPEYKLTISESTKAANNDIKKQILRCTLRGTSNTQRTTSSSNYIFTTINRALTINDIGQVSSQIQAMVGSSNLYRHGVVQDNNAFISCVLTAMNMNKIEGMSIDDFRKTFEFNPTFLKQENIYYTDNEIISDFRDISKPLDGERYYRLLEKCLAINIVIIDIIDNKTLFNIPNNVDKYIWEEWKNKKCVVVCRTNMIEEGSKYKYHYQFLKVSDSADLSNTLILRNKSRDMNDWNTVTIDNAIVEPVIPPYDIKPTRQVVNSDGKCIMIEVNDVWITCFTRPYDLPNTDMLTIEYKSLQYVMQNLTVDLKKWITLNTNTKPDIKIDTHNSKLIGIWLNWNYCPVSPENIAFDESREVKRCIFINRKFFHISTISTLPKYLTIHTDESARDFTRKN